MDRGAWPATVHGVARAGHDLATKDIYNSIYYLQGTYFKYKDTNRLKLQAWKKIYYANDNQKKAGMSILISDKVDFIAK